MAEVHARLVAERLARLRAHNDNAAERAHLAVEVHLEARKAAAPPAAPADASEGSHGNRPEVAR